jgi:hypothetical protein
MSGNTFGKLFTVTTFGESHGPALGCVVDGCPPGLPLAEEDLQARSGSTPARPASQYHPAPRRRMQVRILSGVFEGVTTGTPIGLLIENTDAALEGLRARSRIASARATPITPISRNTACAIIAAAAVPRRGKPRCGWPRAPSRASICTSLQVNIRGYVSSAWPDSRLGRAGPEEAWIAITRSSAPMPRARRSSWTASAQAAQRGGLGGREGDGGGQRGAGGPGASRCSTGWTRISRTR